MKKLKITDTRVHVKQVIPTNRNICGGDVTSEAMYNEILPFLIKSNLEIRQNYSPEMPYIKFQEQNMALQGYDNKIANFKEGRFFRRQPLQTDWQIAKKAADMYYIPKLDVVLGFYLPDSFCAWLLALAEALDYETAGFPILYGISKKIISEIFVPVVGIEFENSINKHCNGGIINLSKYTYNGVLSGYQSAEAHIRFLKENMGINNVTYLDLGSQ